MTPDPCPDCPCAGACLGWPAFCSWAAEKPADPVKLAAIRNRSAMGPTLPPVEVRSVDPDYLDRLPPLKPCGPC